VKSAIPFIACFSGGLLPLIATSLYFAMTMTPIVRVGGDAMAELCGEAYIHQWRDYVLCFLQLLLFALVVLSGVLPLIGITMIRKSEHANGCFALAAAIGIAFFLHATYRFLVAVIPDMIPPQGGPP
jgi:hypothetical protein